MLGVHVNKKEFSFPVGKVDFLTIYPLSFEEFLINTNNSLLIDKIKECFKTNQTMSDIIHKKALELYYDYLAIGGMPEVVKEFINTNSIINAIDYQKDIIESYKNDITKYSEISDAPKILATFDSIPVQLAKENKKFQYKLVQKGGTSATSPGEIEVKFIAKTKTTADSGYRIHPAFNFGGVQQSGIWVGKFETTGSSSTPTILPNVTSLRSQTVSSQFTTAQKLKVTGYDSHISKNSEWGAAVYLSQSKYGKYGNSSYSGTSKEVAQNSNSSCITGGGNYTSNIAQSTTGNITGIYDMSGGAWEYVMGVYNKTVVSSGINFSGIDPKYYDNYTSTDKTTACRGGICYGHALSETAGWYGDYTTFVNSSYPWMMRGGFYNDGANAGVFASVNDNGDSVNVNIILYKKGKITMYKKRNIID